MKINGLDLHVDADGDVDEAEPAPPLVLLHGFTGSGASWSQVRAALGSSRRLITLDALGHGRSSAPPDPRRYAVAHAAADLVAVLDALGEPRCDLLGYSMGARLALFTAVHHRARIRRLILESGTPGLSDAAERAARRASDDALAARIEADGVPAFVAFWERQPLLALAPHVGADVRAALHQQRLDNTAIGLANSLRGMGTGQQEPLWDALSDLDLPVTLIVGAADGRYRGLGERMQAMLPRATLHVVPDAGHTVHLDQPRRFVEIVDCALQEN